MLYLLDRYVCESSMQCRIHIPPVLKHTHVSYTYSTISGVMLVSILFIFIFLKQNLYFTGQNINDQSNQPVQPLMTPTVMLTSPHIQ